MTTLFVLCMDVCDVPPASVVNMSGVNTGAAAWSRARAERKKKKGARNQGSKITHASSSRKPASTTFFRSKGERDDPKIFSEPAKQVSREEAKEGEAQAKPRSRDRKKKKSPEIKVPVTQCSIRGQALGKR